MLSLILPLASSAVAQSQPVEPAPITIPHPRAKVGRAFGIGLTSVGTVVGAPALAMLAGGGVGLLTCSAGPSQPDGCMGPVLLTGAGLFGVAAATPFLATGIPLWAVHQKKVKRNKKALQSVSVLPMVGRRTGLQLSGRF